MLDLSLPYHTPPPIQTSGRNYRWLDRLKTLEKHIRVGIIGAGAMGKGLLYQCKITPGIECVAIADLKVEKAIACAEMTGADYRVVHTVKEVNEAIERGLVAVCEDAELIARCDHVDVFLESSSAIEAAARASLIALDHRKHLVLMNAEIDLTYGPFLMQHAAENGVVYASCDGDQHGVIKRLIDEVQLWGFELVMAGNIKGFLNRYSDPTSIIPEADKRNLDYKMCTAYTDGTKLCIEMAIIANAFGLETAIPGMHGPKASNVEEVLNLFDFDAIRERGTAVVDYILGANPGGGIYVVGYCDHPYQRNMMAYYKMGSGPYYVFYRPYHLCHVEAMQCIAEAYLDNYSLLQPRFGYKTNVIAYAKRDLKKGETLDGIGGYSCYGLIENITPTSSPGLPICLAEDIRLKQDLSKDERITLKHVNIDSTGHSVLPHTSGKDGLAVTAQTSGL